MNWVMLYLVTVTLNLAVVVMLDRVVKTLAEVREPVKEKSLFYVLTVGSLLSLLLALGGAMALFILAVAMP